MSRARVALTALNRLLRRANLRLETLTLDTLENRRVHDAARVGWFNEAVYPLPPSFLTSTHQTLLDELPRHRKRFATFVSATDNDVGFQFDNGFYGSPDAEILYTLVYSARPDRILEVGCGNSTRIIRQAILDAKLSCQHTAIDPEPRVEVSHLANVFIQRPIEHAGAIAHVRSLKSGDVLFIDTSHEVKPANDVTYIYGDLLHSVAAGVIVHIHDIFLPYEYPRHWVVDLGLKFGEQYIVHAMLMNSVTWTTLWPGYYLQQTSPDFATFFPHWRGGMAQSLWLQKSYNS